MKKIIKNWLKQLLNYKSNGQIRGNSIPDLGSNNPFVKIGENCYIDNCTIGSYTYLSKNVSMMNTEIGKFCSVAQGVSICLGKHPSSKFVSTHPAFFSVHKQNGMTFSDKQYFIEMGKTTIGNDVWIGVNAIVMDDITIGNGAIIGAGAVVTRNIPPYAIAVGVPAQVIKYRFEPDQISFLEKFEWWNKEHDWLQEHFTELHDIEAFINKYANC